MFGQFFDTNSWQLIPKIPVLFSLYFVQFVCANHVNKDMSCPPQPIVKNRNWILFEAIFCPKIIPNFSQIQVRKTVIYLSIFSFIFHTNLIA